MHPLFPYLRDLCRILEAHGIRYVLAGGTLLGAVRGGELIEHDYDFDLDCLMDDEERILALRDEFASKNIVLERKYYPADKMLAVGDEFKSGEQRYLSGLKVRNASTLKIIGDIYIFTIFNDGIARRFDCKSRSYANSKMSIPAWYYESTEKVSVRGEVFTTYRDAELVAEKIYGPDWRVPRRPGEFAQKQHKRSGSVLDADLDRLVLNALTKGWDGDYSDRPSWPPTEGFAIIKSGMVWSMAHEPMLAPQLSQFLMDEALKKASLETSPFRIEQYIRHFVSRTWYEHSRLLNGCNTKLDGLKKQINKLSAELEEARALASAISLGKKGGGNGNDLPTYADSKGLAALRAEESGGYRNFAEIRNLELEYYKQAARKTGVRQSLWRGWKALIARIAPKADGNEIGGGDQLLMICSSRQFDPVWYLSKYPDVARAHVDPALHYFRYGGKEGRDPGPNFSTGEYLRKHPEVDPSRINPLIHCLLAEAVDASKGWLT